MRGGAETKFWGDNGKNQREKNELGKKAKGKGTRSLKENPRSYRKKPEKKPC